MASGRLAGNLAGPIRWRAASRQLELPSLAGDLNFSPARPGTSLLKFASEADARVDLQRNSAGGHFTLRSEQQQPGVAGPCPGSTLLPSASRSMSIGWMRMRSWPPSPRVAPPPTRPRTTASTCRRCTGWTWMARSASAT
jgi:hypothetical protein